MQLLFMQNKQCTGRGHSELACNRIIKQALREVQDRLHWNIGYATHNNQFCNPLAPTHISAIYSKDIKITRR